MKSKDSKPNSKKPLTQSIKPSIILTQEQIKTLAEIANHFKDVPQFRIIEESKSGIGPSTIVKFDLFGKDVQIDNTDVSNW